MNKSAFFLSSFANERIKGEIATIATDQARLMELLMDRAIADAAKAVIT